MKNLGCKKNITQNENPFSSPSRQAGQYRCTFRPLVKNTIFDLILTNQDYHVSSNSNKSRDPRVIIDQLLPDLQLVDSGHRQKFRSNDCRSFRKSRGRISEKNLTIHENCHVDVPESRKWIRNLHEWIRRRGRYGNEHTKIAEENLSRYTEWQN